MNLRKLLLLGLIGFYSCAPIQAGRYDDLFLSRSDSNQYDTVIVGTAIAVYTLVYAGLIAYVIYEHKKNTALPAEQLERVAYHEAGHTLIGLHNESITGWPLKDVTIVPSWSGALGLTKMDPTPNKMLLFTKEQYVAHIRIFLGGYVAEELICGQTSSSVSGDLSMASFYARQMVVSLGMHETTGKVFYAGNNCSEQTLQKIDAAVQQIVEEQYEWVKAFLEEKKESLKLLGDALLKEKTLTANQVKELLAVDSTSAENSIA